LWAKRLAVPDPRTRTILAEQDGGLAGFAHTAPGDSPEWGALLDNLHVSYALKRQGVGRRLLSLSARAVLEAAPSSGLYLWVLDQNTGGRAFHAALGGESVERVTVRSLGGDAGRLNGQPLRWRIAWRDPALLLSGSGSVPDAVADLESSD
jgi:GNAT superfamily N-acetyltransferase